MNIFIFLIFFFKKRFAHPRSDTPAKNRLSSAKKKFVPTKKRPSSANKREDVMNPKRQISTAFPDSHILTSTPYLRILNLDKERFGNRKIN